MSVLLLRDFSPQLAIKYLLHLKAATFTRTSANLAILTRRKSSSETGLIWLETLKKKFFNFSEEKIRNFVEIHF